MPSTACALLHTLLGASVGVGLVNFRYAMSLAVLYCMRPCSSSSGSLQAQLRFIASAGHPLTLCAQAYVHLLHTWCTCRRATCSDKAEIKEGRRRWLQ